MFRRGYRLPRGAQVDNYRIEAVLGGGGFSIVYLAREQGTGRQVVLKEYMPSKLAKRAADRSVVAKDEAQADRFAQGRRLFLQEAHTLAGLKHENIVEVTGFFPANGTVYMVMTYAPGYNLQYYIKRHSNLSEAFLSTVFPSLLEGLRLIHSRGLLHLDIKPSNIHLRPGGKPLLLDFGAVHEIMNTRRFQPSQVITPGFAPVEQLDSGGFLGPWTDIYAFGATMRACIEGSPPPSAAQRFEHDTLRPCASLYRRRYSAALLEAIDWAMEVDPMLRPQSVDEFRQALQAAPAPDSAGAGESVLERLLPWSRN